MSLLSRRGFMGLGLGTAACGLLLGAFHTMGQAGDYPDAPFPTQALDRRAVAILTVLGDFLIPPGGPLPGSAGDAESLQLFDAYLATLPEHHRMLMLGLPLLFEHGTALERFGADRMTAMTPERRNAYLTEWAESQDLVRAQLFTALKMVFNMSYFERDDVQQAMGIPQVCAVLA
ncbi:MAG: hypothetical protein H6742_19995 [Alphaproteobacteria bacterium]|nr:hypothetical protein [Alphaproteobacteria bacterium]